MYFAMLDLFIKLKKIYPQWNIDQVLETDKWLRLLSLRHEFRLYLRVSDKHSS
jgi:hypothetical protein